MAKKKGSVPGTTPTSDSARLRFSFIIPLLVTVIISIVTAFVTTAFRLGSITSDLASLKDNLGTLEDRVNKDIRDLDDHLAKDISKLASRIDTLDNRLWDVDGHERVKTRRLSIGANKREYTEVANEVSKAVSAGDVQQVVLRPYSENGPTTTEEENQLRYETVALKDILVEKGVPLSALRTVFSKHAIETSSLSDSSRAKHSVGIEVMLKMVPEKASFNASAVKFPDASTGESRK